MRVSFVYCDVIVLNAEQLITGRNGCSSHQPRSLRWWNNMVLRGL